MNREGALKPGDQVRMKAGHQTTFGNLIPQGTEGMISDEEMPITTGGYVALWVVFNDYPGGTIGSWIPLEKLEAMT